METNTKTKYNIYMSDLNQSKCKACDMRLEWSNKAPCLGSWWYNYPAGGQGFDKNAGKGTINAAKLRIWNSSEFKQNSAERGCRQNESIEGWLSRPWALWVLKQFLKKPTGRSKIVLNISSWRIELSTFSFISY